MGKNNRINRRKRARQKLQSCHDQLGAMRGFCDTHGLELRVCNDGRHWIITTSASRWRADWWPTKGTLVFNSDWDSPINAVTVADLKGCILSRISKPKADWKAIVAHKQLDHGLDSALERDN